MYYELPVKGNDEKYLNELRDRLLSRALFRQHMHHFGGRLYTQALDQFRLLPDNLYAVAVMRAGWGLCNGAMMSNYQGDIGIIDAKRNEQTLKSRINVYKCSRDLEHCETLVFETMLATGGSLSNSIRLLKKRSRARRITALTLLSAPEGLARMQEDHPDVTILTVRIDEKLNDEGFIVPGLGDAGDRYFGPIE